jgi:hypothetical protein
MSNSSRPHTAKVYVRFSSASYVTVEMVPVEYSGTRRKSALRHTLDAGNTATSAVKLAAHKIANAYKKVI